VRLAIAGARGWLSDDIFTTVSRLAIADGVHFIGEIPPADLRPLYCAAELLVLPSLYEGFGLPVLEAMRCGTPVVAARNSSLQEIGDEAVLFTGNTAEELAGSIEELLSFSNHQRVQLIKKASHWEQQFTWDKTAQQTIEVYKKML